MAAIARDTLRLFAPVRAPSEWVTPISRWQFQTRYPTFPPWVSLGRGARIIVGVQGPAFGPFHDSVLKPAYGGRAQVNQPVAAFLRAYQLDGGYTPGPLFAVCALAGLTASALLLLRRMRAPAGRQFALTSLLFTAIAATVLLLPDVYEFSWRYQLPAVVTLVPAGVFGILALVSVRRPAAGPAVDTTPSAAPADLDGQPGGGEHLVGGPRSGAQAGSQPAHE